MSGSGYPIAPAYEGLSEKELITCCQGGELEAFNVLISRYENRVINMALHYVREYHQAVDEAQEIFLKIFHKIGSFQGNSSFSTWLYRVTANHCMNSLRKRKSPGKGYPVSLNQEDADGELPVLRDSKTVSPEEVYAQKELRRHMVALIQQLPDPQRQVIMLCHYEHMSYTEIAEVLELPLTTVRSALFRGRQRLKTWLEKKGGRL
ncbi:MAG: sigma-70 family RNA polymerase sigma factor [Candidatus Firestonebacteria bacterium]|nr:sigma-70 family RNA polymerase sigma factor [Candidatus Firestonebacteria bacterium]